MVLLWAPRRQWFLTSEVPLYRSTLRKVGIRESTLNVLTLRGWDPELVLAFSITLQYSIWNMLWV